VVVARVGAAVVVVAQADAGREDVDLASVGLVHVRMRMKR